MLEHILVPLDGSPLAESVLPHAVALAHAFAPRVSLLHVVQRDVAPDMIPTMDPLDWQLRRAEAEAYLEEVSARLRAENVQAEATVAEGPSAERIIAYAHDEGADLILLSSHGRGGLSEWNISSVVQKVILRSFLPALIVRAYRPYSGDLGGLRYQRVLVPLDGSQRAECVLPLAATLGRYYDATLILAHVVVRPEVPRHTPLTRDELALVNQLTERNRVEAERYLEELRPQLATTVETRLVVNSNTALALHDLVDQEGADLVVLSAHGYSGEARWPYGSVTLNIIVYGTTPLLIVQDLSPEEIQRSPAETAFMERKGH